MTASDDPIVEVWVVKYAFTQGVYPERCRCWTTDGNRSYAKAVNGYSFLRLGRDAFLTREEAVNNAEHRRKQKVASLQKQLKKLKALDFS